MSMYFQNFISNIFVDKVSEPAAAGTGDVNSDAINRATGQDMTFLVPLGAVVGGASGEAKIEGSDDGATGWVQLTDSSAAYDDTMSNKTLLVESQHPSKPYLRCTVTRNGANVELGRIYCMIGGKLKRPLEYAASDDVAVTSIVNGS